MSLIKLLLLSLTLSGCLSAREYRENRKLDMGEIRAELEAIHRDVKRPCVENEGGNE